MAIEVGDAVLKFIGDTSAMDRAFATVGPKAKAAFDPASDAIEKVGDSAKDAADGVEDFGSRTQESMREARGEAALLGEEIGVRLPRHVRNFLAGLPGVGQVLSAAFSATAVLFLGEALVQITQKVEKWIEDTFIFTDAMKHAQEVTNAMQKEAIAHVATMEKLHTAYVEMGENPLEKLRENQVKATQEAGDYRDAVKRATTALEALQNQKPKEQGEAGWWNQDIHAMGEWQKKVVDAQQVLQNFIDKAAEADAKKLAADREANQADTKDAERAANERIDIVKSEGLAKLNLKEAQAKDAAVKLQMTEKDSQAALLNITNMYASLRYGVEHKALEQKLTALRAGNNDTKEEESKLQADLLSLDTSYAAKRIAENDKLIEALNKSNESIKQLIVPAMAARDAIDKIVLPDSIEKWEQWHDAAKDAGITLREDLVKALDLAKEHLRDFEEGGGGLADPVAHKAFQKAVADDQKALENFGKTTQSELGKQGQLWKLYEKDVQGAGSQTKLFTDLGKEQFQQFTNGVGQAFISFANHTSSFQAALGQMAKSAIDSLASQAISQALYWSAVGLADTAIGDAAGASAAFAAATLFGEVAAVSGALALGAGALGGKGGAGGSGSSSPNTYQYNNGQSDSSSNVGSGRTNIGIQHFAEGGLITAPTLAMIGEGKSREAAIPLDDPEAMDTIGKSIAGAGGGGGAQHFHFHAPVIGASDVAKLCGQISKRVARGQAHLNASSTFKVTKRGG